MFLVLITQNTQSGSVTEANFWATGYSEARAAYESSLAQHILAETVDDYGDYRFEQRFLGVNFDRGRRIVAEGDKVNFYTNPIAPRGFKHERALNVIKMPVMQGLLGYRRIIVLKQNLEKFQRIHSFDDLKKLRAGQVSYWADVEIYNENKIPLVVSSGFDSLFHMLERGRFDYLPLGIGEAEKIVDAHNALCPDLAIVPEIIIYYPFPVFFQVSDKFPILTKRIEKGLKQAHSDGSLITLLNHHFGKELSDLQNERQRVFVLRNSNIPGNLNLNKPTLIRDRTLIEAP